ncbi:MAG TPA: DUF1801 domain-containing protein [Nevskiaceae bacterium]|nr:DUF1801 domain-containing protein [Nevskiaceae bacterium]
MTNYSAKNVDEYISAAPEEARHNLKEIRTAVQSAIPHAEEKIGYGKPYYKYHGWVAGFDVYKNHIGFEIWDGLSHANREMLEAEGYKTGNVTFQIKHDQKVPAAIIGKLVKAQAKLNEAKAKNK